jgi:acetamidase/formamidase
MARIEKSMMGKTYYFPKEEAHFTWDTANEPKLYVNSGDTVVYETREVTDGQFTPESTTEDIATLNWDRLYPLAGPVYIEGAEPGDTLEIEILDLQTRGWGWMSILPELGLLAEDFTESYLRTFDLSDGKNIYFREDIIVPIEPFLGTMGVCPKDAKAQAIMPPGTFGGNMDTRQLTVGSKLYLPVQVKGAMFSCGDGHAAQGDGEVCVTALECPLYASLKFKVIKGKTIPSPQFLTNGPLTPKVNHAGFFGTTGVGPDLMEAAKDALRAMIDHLTSTYSLEPKDAYLLSSLIVDLKISEIVDAGQYIVSAVIPQAVFKK